MSPFLLRALLFFVWRCESLEAELGILASVQEEILQLEQRKQQLSANSLALQQEVSELGTAPYSGRVNDSNRSVVKYVQIFDVQVVNPLA
jgi:hypothetical protein